MSVLGAIAPSSNDPYNMVIYTKGQVLHCIFPCIPPVSTLQIVDCVELTGDDDEIKKTNLPSIAFITALDLLVEPQNKWPRGNGPLRLITLIDGPTMATSRWCSIFYFPCFAPLAKDDNGRQ